MVWRNERNFHHRQCGLCGQSIICIYPGSSQLIVYCSNCFFGDGWDGLDCGITYDADTSFIRQYEALQRKTPRIALLSKNSDNSEYTNHAANNRNCFLSTVTFNSEDVYYSRKVMASRSVVDCLFLLQSSELAYECQWGGGIYHSSFLVNCFGVSDSYYCIDCRNCRHCFLCNNLRNREYYFRNRACAKNEYEQLVLKAQAGYKKHLESLELFRSLQLTAAIYPASQFSNCEDCTGDFLMNCRNVHMGFFSSLGEDMRYCSDFDSVGQQRPSRNCMDSFNFGPAELIYEVHGQNNGFANIVNNYSYDVNNSLYLDNCHNCSNCFGCIGLKHKNYCILNKQYTKEEYERLVPKIIAKMRADGEWGEFFPVSMSPFAYNETVAQEYFQLTKAAVLSRGWKWRDQTDEIPKVDKIIPASQLPDSIDEIPDDILNWAIECDVTNRPFKIIKQELEFCRKMRLPVPRLHPDERYRRRMALRNPRKLWNRECQKCGTPIQTSYKPDRPETVYCENCYLQTVY